MVLKRTGVKRRWMKSWERVFFGEVRIMLGSSVGVLRLYSTC